jgi:site-specific DNA-methyltransferase (adenine-specific)
MIIIKNQDCLEGLKDIRDNTVDLIVIDPPYFRIMVREHNGNMHNWDNQWDTFEDYLSWCRSWFMELKRVLKSNGSLYIFSDDKICAYVQIELDKLFNLENSIVWVKPNNMTIKGWDKFRCYSPITERILFYSKESRNSNLENECYAENVKIFAPIIEYMIEQKRKIKEYFNFKTDEQFNEYVNKITDTKSVVSRHYFTYSQWVFPTKDIWEKLQTINNEVFRKEYEVFRKEYEVFRKEYEVFRKEYEVRRRIFSPKKNFTDVWTFNITSSSENTYHPTQKPVALIRRIIETSSKEGDLVLDCFVGSGTSAVASKSLNRNFIGFEISKEYCDVAKERLCQNTLHSLESNEQKEVAIPPKDKSLGILANDL